ncbi:hypothetical protein ACVWWP_008056 [Bradyrhizobium sp. LM3.6]
MPLPSSPPCGSRALPPKTFALSWCATSRAGEEHAVAAARLDGHWLMLDNRRMAMVEDDAARSYQPLFVLYQSAVMKYVDEPVRFSMVAAETH